MVPLTAAARLVFQKPKARALGMFDNAMAHNVRQIRRQIEIALSQQPVPQHISTVLDLGCWDGVNTLACVPDGAQAHGVEVTADAAMRAKEHGIDVMQVDLNEPIPAQDDRFDVVMSNQVIEHVADTDRFVSEAFRVLRVGGTAVVSTENMASWHNIFALLFGWQAFSLTNVSDRVGGVGNPIALWRGAEPFAEKSWQHMRIFSYRGLRELFDVHGFVDTKVVGAGYYPLPSRVANIDPRHAAFITVIGRKPERS